MLNNGEADPSRSRRYGEGADQKAAQERAGGQSQGDNDGLRVESTQNEASRHEQSVAPFRLWSRITGWWTNPFRQRGNFAEHMTVAVSLVIAFIAFLQYGVYRQQKKIMESSGQQTQQLIDAATKNAEAATQFSTIAKGIETKTAEAVAQFQRMADASKEASAAAKSAAETAHESLISTQRAMVDVLPEPEIVWYGQYGDVEFPIVNNGLTRAKGLRRRDNSQFFPDSDMPLDFQFPDSNYPANPIVLGPKAKISTKVRPILLTELQVLRSKPSSHFYIWGWARYRDIFKGTPEHIDKFCFELHFLGTDQVRAGLCGRHNCVDDECKNTD